MKLLLNFSFLLLFSWAGFAQDFTGVVIDKKTNQPLSNVDVYFSDIKTGTVTDENGVFSINHYAQKKIHIQFTYIGYVSLDLYLDRVAQNHSKIYLEEDHYKLDEVVVFKSIGKLQRENTISVVHKKVADIKINAPLTLAEALVNIPGVSQNTTGVGIGKPVIRGLSGNRIVTYSQGIRVENQQWGSEHGLGVGSVGIEGVEVIKGPASLLYGSDALGGVLYFVDERYAKHDKTEGFFQTKFNSATLGTSSSLGYKMHKGILKFNIFGGYTSHADYETPELGKVFNTRFDEKNIKTSVGFNVKNWISNVRYSFLQNNYGIVEDASYTNSTARDFEIPYQSIDNHALSFENMIFTGDSKFDVRFGFTSNYRKEFEEHDHHEEEDHDEHEEEEEEDHEEHAMGLKLDTYTYNLKWYSKKYNNFFDVVLGSQGMLQKNINKGEEVLVPNAETKDFGVFALTNFDLDKLKLQVGLRTDTRTIDTETMVTEESTFLALNETYSGITFSGGALYELDKMSFRANVSSGFRAPTTSELLSNGSHGGTNRYERGNRNLTNETAIQADFSVAYHNEHVEFEINPFYNTIQNYIYLNPTEEVLDENPVFDYVQTNAVLYGGEIGVHFHPHAVHWLHVESDLSTVFAEDTNGDALPLIPQTKLNTVVRSVIRQKGNFRMTSIYLQYVHKFEQSHVSLLETSSDSYGLMNAGLTFEAFQKKTPVEIELGVKNIFNTTYIDHLSRLKNLEIPDVGINFYLGLKYNFDYKI